MAKKAGWNLQTNLKPKPNAQGTLFSGGKDQMPDAKRYPRGYNPQRMRDVQSATIVEGMQQGIGYYRSTRDDVLRTLARSSAPVDDMKHLAVRVEGPEESAAMSKDGVAGSYRKGGGQWGNISLTMGSINSPTVLHEVGHHASQAQGNFHAKYHTPRQRGEEEGYADSYADKHFVPDPAAKKKMLDDGRRGTSHYQPLADQTRAADGTDRRGDFRAGYDYTRPLESRVPNDADQQQAKSAAKFNAFVNRPKRDTLPGF